jgi:hypothetical protein
MNVNEEGIPEEQDALNVSATPAPEPTPGYVDDEELDLGTSPTEKKKEEPEEEIPEQSRNTSAYDPSVIVLTNVSAEALAGILDTAAARTSPETVAARVLVTGSHENIIAQAIDDESAEEGRQRDFLNKIKGDGEAAPTSRVSSDGRNIGIQDLVSRFSEQGIYQPAAEDALTAWMLHEKGVVRRVPLWNSAMTVDIRVPVPSESDALVINLANEERTFANEDGLYYHFYNSFFGREIGVRWILDKIVASSFNQANQRELLLSTIRMPDLAHLYMAMADAMWPNGYDGWRIPCTNRGDPEKDIPACDHVHSLKADLRKMILTRHTAIPPEVITFMSGAHFSSKKHTSSEILDAQKKYPFDGEVIEIGNHRFTMRVPSVREHLEDGESFLTQVVQEVRGDNAAALNTLINLRAIRAYGPWVKKAEKKVEEVIRGEQQPPRWISVDTREAVAYALLEADDRYGDEVRNRMREYVDKCQITYVGYPSMACPKCGHSEDTPSGLLTFDPFSAFFTAAVQYSRKR